MTFRHFIEQALADFEGHVRREEREEKTVEARLRGARQFAQSLLAEAHHKAETTTPQPKNEAAPRRSQEDTGGHRFGGPRR